MGHRAEETPGAEEIRDLVEFVTRSLVDSPEGVTVRHKVADETITVAIEVAADDIGKVIGRQGSTVRAIRTLARAVGQHGGKRVEVEVAE